MGERKAEGTAATLCLWRTVGRLLHSGNEPVLLLARQEHTLTHPVQNPQLFLPLTSCSIGSLHPMVLDSAPTTSRVSE